MKEKIFTTFIIVLLLFVSISGILLPAENVFSYVNTIDSLGEQRSLLNLIFSTNRIELKNKIETYIFESQIRNVTLSSVAKFSWYLQDKTYFDSQFFNTEIFFGIDGNLFPKIKTCNSFNGNMKINLEEEHQNKVIFLLVPLKQEIEFQKLNFFQKYFLCNQFSKSYNQFVDVNLDLISINLYEIYKENESYFEFGDTHWNNFGFNLALLEVLKTTNPEENFKIEKVGNFKENNKVLERLGLINFRSISDQYQIQPIPSVKKKVLIIHDSFFEEAYAPNSYMSEYFDLEYQRWSKEVDLNSKINQFDFVVVQSSLETFFEDRIFNLKN